MLAIQAPFPQYFDLDGSPLSAGRLYFGLPNQNPETNPQTVYWDSDGTQPAAQPIQTLNGYPVRAGSPALVYCGAPYSLTVKDRRGRLIFNLPDSSEATNDQALLDQINNVVANLLASDTATRGAGMVGYGGPQLAYAANTVGFKLKERRSICDAPYNCRSDGDIVSGAGTDWTAQIQLAINDAVAAGELALFVPPGNFKCGQLTIPSRFTLYGAGNYTSVLFCVNAFNADGLLKLNGAGGPPTTVRDLGILAQNGGAGAASIGINSLANGVFIQNVWVSGFNTNVQLANSDNFLLNSAVEEARAGGTGIGISSTDVTVANCVIYNCYIGVGVSGVSYLDGVVLLANNRTVACGFTGFLLVNSNNVQVLGCSAGHNNLSRYIDSGMQITNCANVVVADFVGRLGGGPSTSSDGIKISGGGPISIRGGALVAWRDGISAANVSGLGIKGVDVINNSRHGISTSAGDRINIVGNTAINDGGAGTTDSGIRVVNSASSSVVNIVGNLCTQQGGGVQEYGIYAELTDNGVNTGIINISGNTCTYNTTADIHRVGATQNINLSSSNAALVVSGDMAAVGSGATLLLPPVGNVFHVFGNTGITAVNNPLPGRIVVLKFSSSLTVTDGGNLKLNGNFATSPDDTLTLVGDGTVWYEVARSAN